MGIPNTWAGFETVECYLCHTGFAVEAGLYAARQNDHRSFWCPNGHEQHFAGETADQRRIRELERQVIATKAAAGGKGWR